MENKEIIDNIRAILNRYYTNDIDTGNDHDTYDPDMSAQDALDEITELVRK